jgi:hypothetical protein
MGLLDILEQYAQPGVPPSGDVFRSHFDSVSQQATPQQLGGGIAAAMRSDATPAFGQTISNLFGKSNPDQKAGLLNEIVQVLGPAAGGVGGGILGRILGNGGAGAGTPITPSQGAQATPSDLNTLATAAQQHDDSIVDRLGTFYAQHPTLVKTLGVAALGAVMSHMSRHA